MALVTGASRGIGEGAALRLAAEGAAVAAVAEEESMASGSGCPTGQSPDLYGSGIGKVQPHQQALAAYRKRVRQE